MSIEEIEKWYLITGTLIDFYEGKPLDSDERSRRGILLDFLEEAKLDLLRGRHLGIN